MADVKTFRIEEFNGLLLYLQNIEWTDPFILALIGFHITVTLTSLLTRNHSNFQIILFLALLLLVYFSESLNEIASNNNLLSRQQYFDGNGMFISLIFSAPILLNCMVLVASWLYQSSQLMAQLKRTQLQMRLQAEERQRESASSISPSTSGTFVKQRRRSSVEKIHND